MKFKYTYVYNSICPENITYIFRHTSVSSTYPGQSVRNSVRPFRISILSASLRPLKASRWHCYSRLGGWHGGRHGGGQGGRHGTDKKRLTWSWTWWLTWRWTRWPTWWPKWWPTKKTHSVSKVQENVIFSKSRGIKDVNNDGLRMTIFTCPSSLSPISSSWAILKLFVLAIVHISVTIMYHFVLG